MGLKISALETESFWAQVLGEIQADGGGRMKIDFQLQFKRKSGDELKTLSEAIAAGEMTDRQYVHEIVDGDWKGVEDETNANAFSDEGLDRLITAGLGPMILTAYFKALPSARAKN